MFESIKKVFQPKEEANEPVREFIYLEEEGATPVPGGTGEEAKAFVLSLEGVFEFEKNIAHELPASLPFHVKEFFQDYESVWSPLAEIDLAISNLKFHPDLGLWMIEMNLTWEYHLFCFPNSEGKIYKVSAPKQLPECNAIYETVWHYLWHFYLIHSSYQ
jgi:hypothetical protein